jgi:hypothetical protein
VNAPAAPTGDASVGQSVSASVLGAGNEAGPSSESLTQTIGVSVLPGPLTVSPTSNSVTLTRNGKGHGAGEPYRGELPLVKVVDARGSLVGWNASVSLQGISGVSGSQLAGAQLCVSPNTPTVVAGIPTEVRSAQSSCGALGDAVSLFFAPPEGGGGTFTDTAGLKLVVPESAPGQLTASLAISIQ